MVNFGSFLRKRSKSKHREYDTESIRRGLHSLSKKKRPPIVKITTGPDLEQPSKPGHGTDMTISSMDKLGGTTVPRNNGGLLHAFT